LAQTTDSYDASSITALEGLEHVRKRPGMYIGSTGVGGLHHLVYEVVDNSVDEAMAGHATHIQVTLLADGGCEVVDDGRGIPVDPFTAGEHKGKSAAEVVLTVLHAGGKFGGGGYKVSGGLHGVGVSVVNALSSHLIVDVKNRGHLWRQSFTVGVPDGELEDVRELEPDERTGTTVTYWASTDVFETSTYSLETITARMREYAFLNKGLEIVVRDERPVAAEVLEAVQDDTVSAEIDQVSPDAIHEGVGGGLEQTFRYDRGLVDFVEYLNRRKTLANPTVSFSQAVFEWDGRSVGLLDEGRVFQALRSLGQ